MDSVDVVAAVSKGLGVLAKAPSRVGDMAERGSSLMGDTLRAPRPALGPLGETFFMRWRCCCCRIFSCRLRRRSISSSSGDALSRGRRSVAARSLAPPLAASWASSLMSVSVSVAEALSSSSSSSSSSGRGPGERGSKSADDLASAALRGRRGSDGRVLGGEAVVEEAVASVDEGGGAFMLWIAFPLSPPHAQQSVVSEGPAQKWC